MSQFKVFAVALCVLLTAGLAVAEQQGAYGTGQTSPQQGSQQQGSLQQGTGGTAGSSQEIRTLSQAAEKEKVDLSKAIDKAQDEVKDGQIIGVAVAPQQPGSQQVETHVYVLSQNQVHDVVLDAKGEKVQDKQARQTLSNPWQQAGAAGMQPQAARGTLSSTQAQRIGSLAKEHDADLKQVINKAKQEVRDGQVVGVFLVTQEQVSSQVRQQPGAQQAQVFAKVFAVDQNDQLKVMTLDAKENKVLHTESSQSLSSPWQSSASALGTGQQPGMGGSQQQPHSQQPGMGGSQQQPRSQQPGMGGSQQPGQSGQPSRSGSGAGQSGGSGY
jgi:ribosome-binding factor A